MIEKNSIKMPLEVYPFDQSLSINCLVYGESIETGHVCNCNYFKICGKCRRAILKIRKEMCE